VSGGAVINPDLILPESFKSDVLKTIGMPPPSGKPNTAQHEWAIRAWLTYALDERGPLVSAIWLSDPDATAHAKGIGHPLAIQSLKSVDAQLGVVIKALEDRQLRSLYNIIVTADHGFVTDKGTTTLTKFLLQKGLKNSQTSDDVVVAGNAVYVKDHSRETIQRIVSALQEQSWVGAVFTKGKTDGSVNGWVDGTLSFESIHWNHERSADLLVDYNWDDSANEFGLLLLPVLLATAEQVRMRSISR
jgi:predicted AlkP superfamily pyrophosphatase or phosphodiesterase